MKEISLKHKIFADLYLKTGDVGKSYLEVYPSDNEKPQISKAYTVLQRPEVKKYIEDVRRQISDLVSDKIKKEIPQERIDLLLTVIEKREILAKIARGELTYLETIGSAVGPITVEKLPSYTDRISAIKEENKMVGDYATEKKEITFAEGTTTIILNTGREINA